MPYPIEEDRCTFTYIDGRRCRMQKIETHPYLCYYHWQRGQQANDAVVFASQLLNENQQLNSPAAVIDVLSGVFRLLAQGRLETRQAATMAYVCQLALQALPQAEKQQRAVAEARGETTDLFDTIQKGSFEEDYVKRMLNNLRGKREESLPAAATNPETTASSALTSEPDADPEGVRVPGTLLTLPPPLERAYQPPASGGSQERGNTCGEGATVRRASRNGLAPEEDRQLAEAGRMTPEEALQRREERAREFGPPILVTTASERAELDRLKKKRGNFG